MLPSLEQWTSVLVALLSSSTMRPFWRSGSWRRFVEGQIPEVVGPTAADFRADAIRSREIVLANVKAGKRNRVVLAGSSGLLGTALDIALRADGHMVYSISRRNGHQFPHSDTQLEWWKVMADGGLPECDTIVQVTGANIMDTPLTEPRLQEHYNSRVGITKLLANRAKYLKEAPKTFIHASCTAMYPSDTETVFTEDYNGGYSEDFIGEMFQHMEEEAHKVFGTNTRIVHIRLGHLLAPEGLLQQAFFIDPKNRWHIGHYGNGQQWFPWIHFADAADIFCKAVEDKRYNGIINAVAPGIIRQKDIGRTMKALCTDRRSWTLPAPNMVAKWMHTDRAFYLLQSRKVLPSQKLEDLEFEFRFPTIDVAIKDLWEHYKHYDIQTIPETPADLLQNPEPQSKP